MEREWRENGLRFIWAVGVGSMREAIDEGME